MQAPDLDSVLDRFASESKRAKLPAGDHIMLALRETPSLSTWPRNRVLT
jgi:hypothetical protein